MDHSFNPGSRYPSYPNRNVFSELVIDLAEKSSENLDTITDDIEDRLFHLFPLYFLRNSNDQSIIWGNLFSDPQANYLGGIQFQKITSFWKDFFSLTQKKDLSEDDLLKFELTHPQLQNCNLYTHFFLGHPFFRSNLSLNGEISRLLEGLLVAMLVIFRYKILMESLMSIRKARGLSLGAKIYKKFGKCFIVEGLVMKQIAELSSDRASHLPPNFWVNLEKFTC